MNRPKQLHLDVKLDEAISLENFIDCSSTEIILQALRDFISESKMTRTFFLWGKEGTGKNYLLHSTNKKFLENNLHTAFISFTNNFFEDTSIFEGLEKMDVVFIEAIDQFPSDNKWELALFNLINACFAKGSQLLITSKLPAKDLEVKLPDLKSRLLAFLAFELPEITDEEKIRALKESANRKGLTFDEKVQSYVLNHTSRSLSDLLKLLVDLDTFSLERKRKISISLVKDLLANKEGSPSI